LNKHAVKGSFFLTGNFYNNKTFGGVIRKLKRSGHCLGAHSDKHLLYADWRKRDSLLVTRTEFAADLMENYKKMQRFGIRENDARYFVAPFEWYNSAVVQWTNEAGFHLINFTPGTLSHADYTYPEMEEKYRSSEAIMNSILKKEKEDENGLNGFILLIHIGTDPRRTDKFYDHLDTLITTLKSRGYTFQRIDELLN
jgi:peptidoglycan/xylan/chitin deacetylase (PgdA/CDA1 family)